MANRSALDGGEHLISFQGGVETIDALRVELSELA
jgi:hypothetical protein